MCTLSLSVLYTQGGEAKQKPKVSFLSDFKPYSCKACEAKVEVLLYFLFCRKLLYICFILVLKEKKKKGGVRNGC